MASENDFSAFSVRIPTSLCDQVDNIRKVSKRSRNAEIELLLTEALDARAAKDKLIMEAMARFNHQQSSQS